MPLRLRLSRWVLIALAAYLGWKFVPVYSAALRFDSYVGDRARYGARTGLSAQEIESGILRDARDLELPVQSQDIDIHVGTEHQIVTDERLVVARVAYQVPVNMGPRQVLLNFHASALERAEVASRDVRELKHFAE